MKTPWLIGIVVAVHIVAIGSLGLIQGCGTLQEPEMGGAPVILPPPAPFPEQPAPVAQRAPQVEPEVKTWPAQTTEYVVRKGDSLSKIASRYDLTVAQLVALNGIENPDRIRVGQTLQLPGNVDLDAPLPEPSQPAAARTRTAEGGVYEVQKGDCLSVIASRFGTTTAALRKANNLSGDMIRVGEKLVIPGTTPGATVEAPRTGAGTGAGTAAGTAAGDEADDGLMAQPTATSMNMDFGEPEQETQPTFGRTTEASTETGGGANTGRRVITHEYTVQEGDDLEKVAMMWFVSVADLRRVNNLTTDALRPGQVLKIPMAEE